METWSKPGGGSGIRALGDCVHYISLPFAASRMRKLRSAISDARSRGLQELDWTCYLICSVTCVSLFSAERTFRWSKGFIFRCIFSSRSSSRAPSSPCPKAQGDDGELQIIETFCRRFHRALQRPGLHHGNDKAVFEHDGGHFVPNKKDFLKPVVDEIVSALGL